jgi:hypothetical protein
MLYLDQFYAAISLSIDIYAATVEERWSWPAWDISGDGVPLPHHLLSGALHYTVMLLTFALRQLANQHKGTCARGDQCCELPPLGVIDVGGAAGYAASAQAGCRPRSGPACDAASLAPTRVRRPVTYALDGSHR